MSAAELYKIGHVGRELGLSERRIREYERAGLIRPARQARTGYRLFSAVDMAQIRVIRRLIQEKGYSVEALRDLLSYAPCWELTACAMKHSCAVRINPNVPCYAQRAAGVEARCGTSCERCPLFRMKDRPRWPIVILPPVLRAETESVVSSFSEMPPIERVPDMQGGNTKPAGEN